VTVGPRAGFFACWALLATYTTFLAANFAEIGLFGQSFFSGIGIWDTLYKNLWPRPPHPYNLFPYIVAGWLAVGIAITLAFPRLTRRIGRNLSEAEGIAGAES
jgi:predicted membrane channel-forming protein YqfA (hemolysin III family)